MKLSHYKHPWRWAAGLFILLALTALAIHFERASRFEPAALTPPPGSLVLDCRDQILRLSADSQGRRVILLPPGPLPEMVTAAFLAAEDALFREHHGIAPRALARAIWSNLKAGRIVSGASTITQQLARLAYPADRTFYHKLVEMLRSLRIEAALSKDEILRCYLNLVPQGNNLMGVETAARLYFHKPAAQLTPAEAAVLAALAKAPGSLNPLGPQRQRLVQRRNWVLQRMTKLGFLTDPESAAARQTGLKLRTGNLFPFEAPHFVNLVQAAAGPEPPPVLHTTLDLNLQRRTQAIVLSHRARLHKGGISQAAAVILKNRSLEVVALVGSFQYGPRDQGFNNGALARRSPGSTLKPFLYAQALDLGHNPARMLADVDSSYRTPRGEFIPANFDRVAHGPISMREALGNSLNLAAVGLLQQVGPAAFYDILNRLQLINHPERPADYYGLGLVVGNPEVSLLQLAAAFASLANGGSYRPAACLKQGAAVTPEPIFSPQAAYIISDILADAMARARVFGASLAMNPPFPLALKTGTSTHYRDCWAVGYSPEYTLAVWTGNFDGRATAKMSGATAAAPILADLAAALLTPDRSPSFTPPSGLVSREICSFSGLQPGPGCRHRRTEWFIAGTEPEAQCTYHPSQEPWHRMPTNFAGWLHHRYQRQGTGRYRLADFDADLARTFGEQDSLIETPQGQSGLTPRSDPHAPKSQAQPDGHPSSPQPISIVNKPSSRAPLSPPGEKVRVRSGSGQPSGNHKTLGQKLSFGRNPALHLHDTLFPALATAKDPRLTIASPLPGDRFLLAPGQETVAVSLKASCRAPFRQVTWYVDGREYAATGPPYELPLQLGRGRHHLTVIGPDGLGDNLEVAVE
jgi:penicillin-binding protein 1C